MNARTTGSLAARRVLNPSVVLIALGFALAPMGAAQAQYLIGTTASGSAGAGSSSALYSYNYNGLNQFPGAGSRSVISPCTSNATLTCSATGTGPVTPSAALTSAAVSAAAGLVGTDFYGNPFNIQAGATASADLATGAYAITATGSYYPNQLSGVGSSQAVLSDTLDFTVAGATPTTVTDIGVSLSVTGSMTLGTTQAYGSEGNTLVLGGGSFSDSLCAECAGNPTTTAELSGTNIGGWVSYNLSADGLDFTGVYALTGPTADLNFETYSSDTCVNGATCSYDGAVSLTLPQGVAFTSGSGVFLSGPAVGVPEPTAWAMTILGLASVGALLRRRRSAGLDKTGWGHRHLLEV